MNRPESNLDHSVEAGDMVELAEIGRLAVRYHAVFCYYMNLKMDNEAAGVSNEPTPSLHETDAFNAVQNAQKFLTEAIEGKIIKENHENN